MKATCCYEMPGVVCLHQRVFAILKMPSVSERCESGRVANGEQVCVSGLAAAQLPLLRLISRLCKSLSLSLRRHTPPNILD